MKKIFLILVLIFALPVFAGQKTKNWVQVWTSDDGIVWYYDSNSTKSMFFDNDFYGTAVKSYDKSKDETKYYTYCFECVPTAPLYWSKMHKKVRNVRWVGGPSSTPNIKDISGNLYNEICGKGKIQKSDEKLPFNIKIKSPIFNYDIDIQELQDF